MIKKLLIENGFKVRNLIEIFTEKMETAEQRMVTTGDYLIDDQITGGDDQDVFPFVTGTIVDLYGEAGSGKTNFALQVAIWNILDNRQHPRFSSVYISINKTVSSSRVQSMFKHIREALGTQLSQQEFDAFTTNFVNLHYSIDDGNASMFDFFLETDVIKPILNKQQVKDEQGPVKVVVIDTLHFLVTQLDARGGLLESERETFLFNVFESLRKLANAGVFVLMVNNAVSNFEQGFGKGKIKAAMGDYYGNLIDERLKIAKPNSFEQSRMNKVSGRTLEVIFSQRLPKKKIRVMIHDAGVSGFEKDDQL